MKTLGEMITYICSDLNISERLLATNLGISDRALNTWKDVKELDAKDKQLRLNMYYAMCKYLKDKGIKQIYNFMGNSRIVVDPTDEEYGDTAANSYCHCYPTDANWVEKIDQAIKDWDNS